MKFKNFKIGDHIRFHLKSSYSKQDIEYGCDPRVNGMTGTITKLWDIDDTCVVKLDIPLTYEDKKTVYEYWDFVKNMEEISYEDTKKIDKEPNLDKLKNYLYNKQKKYNAELLSKNSISIDSKLQEINEILKYIATL
ncbi:MAG: hypothetical protein PHX70_08720 [Clostridium sp.]|nr:hypothetical protein [Clostridium sp.]